ncbi:uncharacterized protein LOC133651000 isoform X3 [Entelurus aequoreus]|uniref:uncharacterized protein LOC133651000 isoform X3 n=1 Tax=Entelurus aequoreus TaxID=161455 RepID=UPI002B1D12EF|nr:uncharacterized protein LOC133651000 isoform X3 [Entelurus aequoreus]
MTQKIKMSEKTLDKATPSYINLNTEENYSVQQKEDDEEDEKEEEEEQKEEKDGKRRRKRKRKKRQRRRKNRRRNTAFLGAILGSLYTHHNNTLWRGRAGERAARQGTPRPGPRWRQGGVDGERAAKQGAPGATPQSCPGVRSAHLGTIIQSPLAEEKGNSRERWREGWKEPTKS